MSTEIGRVDPNWHVMGATRMDPLHFNALIFQNQQSGAVSYWLLNGLYLFTTGNTVGAIIIIVSGSIIVFIADHFVRPVLIGGAARLPFLWVLLGILGGLETFGFLGLFLGPAMMAALIALWREWTEVPAAERIRPAPARRPAAGRARKT